MTERQRAWLKHVRSAERRGEALTEYAKRRGLSVGSLYEAKRRLRQVGVLPAARKEPATKARAARFVELAVHSGPMAATQALLRIQLPNGTVLEWSEAPQGEALRDLFGIVS
jgi:hypothetical protein